MSDQPSRYRAVGHRVKSLFRPQEDLPTISTNKVVPKKSAAVTLQPTKSSSTEIQRLNDNDVPNAFCDDHGEMSTKAELLLHETEWAASKTPLWDQAVSDFRAKHSDEYEELMLPTTKTEYDELELSNRESTFEQSILNKELPDAFREERSSQHAYVRRLKSWLPALGAAKGLAMTLARLDPYQMAPYIVAGAFFAIEILLHTIPVEQQEACLDILCDGVIIMLKWRSFEENISPSHQSLLDASTKDAVQRLQSELPNIYTLGLKLQARVRKEATSRKRFSGAALIGRVDAWKADLAVLKRKDRDCIAMKDTIKECLERQDRNSKVLRWIRKESTPDPHHEDIKRKTGMNQDAYRQAGRWFLEGQGFKEWTTPSLTPPTQRVIWLKGTRNCQAVSRLLEEEDRRPHGDLRIAYYYCSASATGTTVSSPDTESVVRSLCRRLAWQPTATIAKCANEFHAKFSSEVDRPPLLEDWEALLSDLVRDSAAAVILVIDGLDECLEPERLLKNLAEAVQCRSNLYIIFSSRHHVRVSTYFRGALSEIDTMTGRQEPDMDTFIETMIEKRRQSPETEQNIFFDKKVGSVLLQGLREALRAGAGGMFRWVEIWLSILFPPDEQSQVIESDDARNVINQIGQSESIYRDNSHDKLMEAYKALWKANSRARHKDLQPRLFQLVLCSFDRLTLKQLTEALRIDAEGKIPYREELQPNHVEWLCHNFLVALSNGGLEWAHKSAKDFITRGPMEGNDTVLSATAGHLYVSQIALQMMGQICHPAWKVGGLDLSRWQQRCQSQQQTASSESDFQNTVQKIYDATKRARIKHSPDKWESNYSFPGSESLLRNAMVSSLEMSEHLSSLVPLLEATTFAAYVATRFVHHLRIACNTRDSASGLEQPIRSMIASRQSALPAVATLLESISSIRSALRQPDPSEQEDHDGSWSIEDFSMFRQLTRNIEIATHWLSACKMMNIISIERGGKSIVAPPRLLTIINTSSDELISFAITTSNSGPHTVDWESYLSELLFLACEYNSDRVAAFLLDGSSLPTINFPTTRTLLRREDKYGRLPIHLAAVSGHPAVIQVLLEAEERSIRASTPETRPGDSDTEAPGNDVPKLLYTPDSEGDLSIHLTTWATAERAAESVKLMLEFDAKNATLFPTEPSNQEDVPGLLQKPSTMLLAENYYGYLPIHLATSRCQPAVVREMLAHEFEAFCTRTQTHSRTDSTRLHHQPRSRLLYARSENVEPLDFVLFLGTWIHRPQSSWECMQTLLEYEAKWADLDQTLTPQPQLRSELLNSRIIAKIILHWQNESFKPEWLRWLLDRYEIHPSAAVRSWLAEIRKRMPTATADSLGLDRFAFLQKQDDSLLRRLESLADRSELDEAVALREFEGKAWPLWNEEYWY